MPLNAFRHCRLVISAAFLVPTEIRSGLRHVVTLCHVVTSPKLCRNYLHTEEVVQNPWFRQMARCNISAFSELTVLTMLKRFNRIVSSRLADQWRHTKDNPSNSSVQPPCRSMPCTREEGGIRPTLHIDVHGCRDPLEPPEITPGHDANGCFWVCHGLSMFILMKSPALFSTFVEY